MSTQVFMKSPVSDEQKLYTRLIQSARLPCQSTMMLLSHSDLRFSHDAVAYCLSKAYLLLNRKIGGFGAEENE